jgi:hypothetical protein
MVSATENRLFSSPNVIRSGVTSERRATRLDLRWSRPDPPRAMVVTDLDGTLLRGDGTVGKRDLEALHRLGEDGVARVVATGRSPFSFRRATRASRLPIDYVVLSSGAAVFKEPEEKLLRRVDLTPSDVRRVTRALLEAELDFMVHAAAPHNHRFYYHETGRRNPDFRRRIELYREYCCPWPRNGPPAEPSAQIIIVVPEPYSDETVAQLSRHATGLNVIRTTSPIDGRSLWLEVFPLSVSKSRAAAWLAAGLGLTAQDVCAVGNDYNDEDLLDWSGHSYVVENGVARLREAHAVVRSNEQCGVAHAVERWLTPS